MDKVSIVIPAFNEAQALEAGKLERLARWLAGSGLTTEIIVVDDGSSDNTANLAQRGGATVETIPHAGKAAALIAGIRRASGQVVLMTDMDQATPITELPKLLAAMEGDSSEICIGSRGLVREGAPASRYLMSWGQMTLRTLLLGFRVVDTQCGFKAFRRDAALEILDHLVVYAPNRLGTVNGPSVTSGFDVEFLFVGSRLGYRISEVPVRWSYQESRRVSLWKDSVRGVLDLLAITGHRIRGAYPTRAGRREVARAEKSAATQT